MTTRFYTLRIIQFIGLSISALFLGASARLEAGDKSDAASERLSCYRAALKTITDPEIEAKLSVPDNATMELIKKLEGKKIKIKNSEGKTRTYKVEFNKEHIYEDTYYDIIEDDHLLLYDKRGLLRERKRTDKDPETGAYVLAKLVTQAKNGPASLGGKKLSSISARNEIKGDETKDQDKFESTRDERLSRDSDDKAVKFARKLAGSPKGKFVPVLFSRDERFFLKLSPTKKTRDSTSFYLSVDKVTNKGLVGSLKSGNRREVEVEIIDDMTKEPKKKSAQRVYLLQQISKYLEKRFSLTPSKESKYEGGVIDGVFSNPDFE